MEQTYKEELKGYDGYYWLSDAASPVDFSNNEKVWEDLNEKYIKQPSANPFVIEANLFNRKDKTSISVKYVDGQYVVKSFKVTESISDVAAANYDDITLKKFVAHRMPGSKLLFFQYWRPIADHWCADMNVLQPAEIVFVGFETLNTVKEK